MVVYCGQGLWSVVCGGLHLGQPAACQMSANHVKVSSRTATVLEASVMKSTHKTCLTVKYSSTSHCPPICPVPHSADEIQ